MGYDPHHSTKYCIISQFLSTKDMTKTFHYFSDSHASDVVNDVAKVSKSAQENQCENCLPYFNT